MNPIWHDGRTLLLSAGTQTGHIPAPKPPASTAALTFLISATISMDQAAGYITVAVLNTWAISFVDVLERIWYGLCEKRHEESILIYLFFQTPWEIFLEQRSSKHSLFTHSPSLPLKVSACVIVAQLNKTIMSARMTIITGYLSSVTGRRQTLKVRVISQLVFAWPFQYLYLKGLSKSILYRWCYG